MTAQNTNQKSELTNFTGNPISESVTNEIKKTLLPRHILHKINKGVTELNFRGNKFATSQSLIKLQTNSYESMEPEGARIIGEALKTNTSVTKMDLSYKRLT